MWLTTYFLKLQYLQVWKSMTYAAKNLNEESSEIMSSFMEKDPQLHRENGGRLKKKNTLEFDS